MIMTTVHFHVNWAWSSIFSFYKHLCTRHSMHTYVQIQDKEHIIHSPYCIGSVCSSPPLAFSSFWLYVPGPTLGTVLPEGWVSGLGAWSYILQRRTLTAYYSCENITKDKLYIALLYNYSNSDVIDSCCCCYGKTNLRLLV